MTDHSFASLTRRPGDRAEIRFERLLSHPREKVWHALTDPGELAYWFPCRIEGELVPGGALRFVFPDGEMEDTTGLVLAADPPRLLELRWDTDLLRFELAARDGACRLVFTHTMDVGDHPTPSARTAAGWDGCLAQLAARLDGRDVPSSTEHWSERNAAYLARFAEQ